MRCHFVYSVPINGQISVKVIRKIKITLQNMGLPISIIGPRENLSTQLWPNRSPFSITKTLYERLAEKLPTLLYHLSEKVKINFSTDDIFLGHPMFPFVSGVSRVTELALSQSPRPRTLALISPLHCNLEVPTSHINHSYLKALDRLVPKADVLFAIMGQYWWDQWDNSPFAHWKEKMIRLDMAVDTEFFPRIKNYFNKPSKRGFLYIGRNDPMKGIPLLSKLMTEMKEFPCGWIGAGPDIPGVPRVSPPRTLTPDFMKEVSQNFDFFITTGVADPNPTTILESMAWGFPVICTPQSGYYETTYLRNVYHDDIAKSLETLRELQFAPEEELKRMADDARISVETNYSWDKFISTIFATLRI